MRKFLLVIGLAFFIGSIVLIDKNFEKFDVERNGQVVKTRIESLPKSCIGSRVPYFVKFSYNGELYDKQVRGSFCEEHSIGEIFEMKILLGSQYILFPNESALSDLLSFGILGLLGLLLSIIQWKKMAMSSKRY